MCGKSCPIIARSEALFKVKEMAANEFTGSAPAPFVGHYGYPFLNVGLLSIPEIKENAWEYDAPRHWSGAGYKIPQIVEFRRLCRKHNQKVVRFGIDPELKTTVGDFSSNERVELGLNAIKTGV